MVDFNFFEMYAEKEPEIYAYKCPECGKLYYPAPMICDECNTRRDPSNVIYSEWEKIPIKGKCKLLTWTRVYALPDSYEVPFLLFGIVEFENGLRASGQLQVEKPEIGMILESTVGVVKVQNGKEINGLIFKEVAS